MKGFVSNLSFLVGLLLVLGGAASGVFEACTAAMPLIMRFSNTLGTLGAACIGFVALAHVALTLSVLPSMPSPDKWNWTQIAQALALGVSALLFLAFGLPTLGLHQFPDNVAVACAEFLTGFYGWFFGITATVIALSAATIKALDTAQEKLEEITDEVAYFLRNKVRSRS